MAGMTGHAGAIAGNPALALVLSAGMLGYIVWAIDQLLSRTRPDTARAVGTVEVRGQASRRDGGSGPLRGAPDPHLNDAAGPPLAPRVAACQKITMGLAMGYMLLTML